MRSPVFFLSRNVKTCLFTPRIQEYHLHPLQTHQVKLCTEYLMKGSFPEKVMSGMEIRFVQKISSILSASR